METCLTSLIRLLSPAKPSPGGFDPGCVMLAVRARRAEQVIERARDVAELVSAARGRPLPEAALSEEHAREWVDAVHADRDR